MAQTAKKQAESPEIERLSISKLAFRFNLNTATVAKRLQLAGIDPVETGPRLKLFELTEKVEKVLDAIHDPLAEVKLRSATADAEYREAKVAAMRGDLVPLAEAQELTQRIFATLHREIVIAQPKRLAGKLARVKTPAEASKLLKTDSEKIFRTLRDEPESFLK